MGTVSHVSGSGLAFIASWSPFAPQIQRDLAGRPVIGHGHHVRAGELFLQPIDAAEALHLLHDDLALIELGLSGLQAEAQLEQHQFDALASFVHSTGLGAFLRSHLCELVRQRLFNSASAEFSRWCRVGGQVCPALQRRRDAEAALFMALPAEVGP